MSVELSAQQRGAKLRKILEDRNAQNKTYKRTLLKQNYKIGYYEPGNDAVASPSESIQ